jgi:hypothetical protein
MEKHQQLCACALARVRSDVTVAGKHNSLSDDNDILNEFHGPCKKLGL